MYSSRAVYLWGIIMCFRVIQLSDIHAYLASSTSKRYQTTFENSIVGVEV